MYTRCPECQTAFRITLAHLKARDGLVRCGRCDSVFRADLHLFAPPSGETNHQEQAAESEMYIELGSGEDERRPEIRADIPIVSDLSLFQPRRRLLSAALWLVALVGLGALLLGQFTYFYRHELAQISAVRPALVQLCEMLRCELASFRAHALPELVQTTIAPHPRYANALRVRATIANRTEEPLTFPLMQVSLTDSDGKVLARRTFTSHEYLEPSFVATELGPHVLAKTLLDVTNPDNKAAGYEVQLFPQQHARVD
jgi:predicted Zn finger-like uncharacterized protein